MPDVGSLTERNNNEKCFWNIYNRWFEGSPYFSPLAVEKRSGSAKELQLGLLTVPSKSSQLVWGTWLGAAEGFEKFLQGVIKKALPAWPVLCVQHKPDCSRSDSCPAVTWGRQSLLESELGLLSSAWNPWHYTTHTAHSLLLKQMELIPGQRLLCKYSQEQLSWSVAWLLRSESSQHPVTAWHGWAQCLKNPLVHGPTSSWLLPWGSKSRAGTLWVI